MATSKFSLKPLFAWLKALLSESKSGIPSIRRLLAIIFSIDLIINIHNSAKIGLKVIGLVSKDKQIDANIVTALGSNLSQIVLILGIEAGLIAALLSLTTYSSIVTKKIEGPEQVANQSTTTDTSGQNPPIEQVPPLR